MTTQRLTCFALALAIVTAACASASGSGATGSTQRGSSELLTSDEIMKSAQPTAYRVIQTERPQWLLVRRIGGAVTNRVETVKVYVQGNRQSGGLNALEQIVASTIKEIRYLPGREATTRFGLEHGSGAILVTLR